eukprot:2180-Heterococcus_DN1.PRE.1
MAADADSKSTWARTKAQGELEVRREFPDATIVRPGKMFGDEDRLLNWIANVPSKLGGLPLIDDGKHLLQPVWVQDVAEAIVGCVDNEWQDSALRVEGKTLELAGPEEYTWRELQALQHRALEVTARLMQCLSSDSATNAMPIKRQRDQCDAYHLPAVSRMLLLLLIALRLSMYHSAVAAVVQQDLRAVRLTLLSILLCCVPSTCVTTVLIRQQLRDFVDDITENNTRVFDVPAGLAETFGGFYEQASH